jgi:hypothetical protein
MQLFRSLENQIAAMIDWNEKYSVFPIIPSGSEKSLKAVHGNLLNCPRIFTDFMVNIF